MPIDEDGETLEDRTIARLERRVRALEAALRPFAEAADPLVLADNAVRVESIPATHCRHARKLLAPPQGVSANG